MQFNNPDVRRLLNLTRDRKNMCSLGVRERILLAQRYFRVINIKLDIIYQSNKYIVVDINRIGKSKYAGTALFGAVYNYRVKSVKFLLDLGADANIRNKIGLTPLLRIACCSRLDYPNLFYNLLEKWTIIVKMLVNFGANINVRGKYGHTALMYCSNIDTYYSLHKVKVLIEAGANKDLVNDNGYTSLDVASQAGKNDVVRFLGSLS